MTRDEKLARKRAHYHKNQERELARMRQYRADHRERINARRREIHKYDPKKWGKSLQRLYGVTEAQYDALFAEQDGRCAICREPERATQRGRTVRLGVDHNHETGRVRGLLCRACNRAVGTIENREFVASIHAYLVRYELLRGVA